MCLELSKPLVWFDDEPAIVAGRIEDVAERIDPNTASSASLRRLPGIGPVLARAITQYRTQHGPIAFTNPSDLAKISGIGPGTVNRIRSLLSLAPTDRNYLGQYWRE